MSEKSIRKTRSSKSEKSSSEDRSQNSSISGRKGLETRKQNKNFRGGGGTKSTENSSASDCTGCTSTSTSLTTFRNKRISESDSICKKQDDIDEELADLVKKMTVTSKNAVGTVGSIPNSVCYYGWFFSSSVSASLKLIAHKYFTTCYETSKQFQRFLTMALVNANITDHFSYYRKPPSTDSSYHVTAKFCGREPCISYAELVNPSIGKKFDLQIIGIFFTKSTYGFRLKLSKSQEILFDQERLTEKPSNTKPNSKLSAPLKGKKSDCDTEFEGGADSEYFGIRLKCQEKSFNPSPSRAHITIGCAPGVKAIQTGLDLLDIISLENRKTYSIDTEIDGATLRQYGRGNGDAFVIYFDCKYIAKAVFMSVA